MRYRMAILVAFCCAAFGPTAGAQPTVYPEVLSVPFVPAGLSLDARVVPDSRGPLLLWSAADSAAVGHLWIARLDSTGHAISATQLPRLAGAVASFSPQVASDGTDVVVVYVQSFVGGSYRPVGQRLGSTLNIKGDPFIFPEVTYPGAFTFKDGRFIWYGADEKGNPRTLSFTAETMESPQITTEAGFSCSCRCAEPARVANRAVCVSFSARPGSCSWWYCSKDETFLSFTRDDGSAEVYTYPFLINLAPALAADDEEFFFVWRDGNESADGHLVAILTPPSARFGDPMERTDKIVIDTIPSTAPLDAVYVAWDGERFGIVWSVRMQLHFATLDPRTREVSNIIALESDPPRPWFYWSRQNTNVTVIGRGRFLVSYELGVNPSAEIPDATHVLAGRVISVPVPTSRTRVVR